MQFDPKTFERKWQEYWQRERLYEMQPSSDKKPCYVLDMFPYPSGSSMHVGHPRGYVATDVYSRLKRMQGYNVLHPMGWDAFGLPAEETAIANKEYPTVTVERNIATFKEQLTMLGLGYDWSREINTTDPTYYVHTQRIFLELFRRGLAVNSTMSVNWCPALGTVLANEDIVDGKSERGGHPVFQERMRQWVLLITKYADRLIDDLELLPQWPEKVKNAQRSWIGRSSGWQLSFTTTAGVPVPVFTTRIETLPGVTFVVVAPESTHTESLLAHATNAAAVQAYVEQAKQKTELDRQVTTQKTGVIVEGVTATNPLTGDMVPIVVADYVLASYGTGAVMAVPGHDERDAEMAAVLGLPIISVIEDERMVRSGAYDGMTITEAQQAIARAIGAESEQRYKMRDWVFSRQRFWGEPFPIVWVAGSDAYQKLAQGPLKDWIPREPVSYVDGDTTYFAVPVLPQFLSAMQLPKVESYEPTGTLEGPLAGIDAWVNTTINVATGEVRNGALGDGWVPARRETNTMPQWAGSSWYWLRFMDPHNAAEPFAKDIAAHFGPVNVYAGADHATAHLIYARFWHKVLQDAGMVDFPEPFERLEFLGYILAADGTKISKRKGNSKSPEAVVEAVGADAFRLYEMFIGPFEKPIPWSDDGLVGARRFLERVWKFAHRVHTEQVGASSDEARAALHKALKKVGEDIEAFRFNTAVSSMMICMNTIEHAPVTVADAKLLVLMLAPFAPHMTEELWELYGATDSVHRAVWPTYNPSLVVDETITVPVQVNGKIRAQLMVAADIDEATIIELALTHQDVCKFLGDATPQKVIYVPQKIVSVVV